MDMAIPQRPYHPLDFFPQGSDGNPNLLPFVAIPISVTQAASSVSQDYSLNLFLIRR